VANIQPPVKRYRKLPRNILTLMVTFIAGMSVIMIYYRYGSNPEGFRTQKKEDKEQRDVIKEQPGDPVKMRALLEQGAQRARDQKAKEDRLPKTPGAASEPNEQSGTSGNPNADMPAWSNVPGKMPPGSPNSIDGYESAKLQVQKAMQEQGKANTQIEAFEYDDDAGQRPAGSATGNAQLDSLLAQIGKAGKDAENLPSGIDAPTIQRLLAQNGTPGALTKTAVRADEDWLNKQSDHGESGENAPIRAKPPLGPYALYYGTWIPCDLMYAIDSDLPGDVSCQVAKDIWSIGTNPLLLIPQYSVLHGKYNVDISSGQERILIAFRRLNFPSGAHADLTAMTASDSTGRAGAGADVNDHFWKIFGSSFLISGVATLASRNEQGGGSNVTVNAGGPPSTLSGAAGQVMVNTVQQILARNTTIKPTLQNDPFKDHDGISRLMVFVNHDMILDPDITQTRAK
jgi:type IV secretory pathway VirB10-like protein